MIDEREEQLLWRCDEPTFEVYSFNKAVWKACAKKKGILKMSHIRRGKELARDYVVPLDGIRYVSGVLAEEAIKKAQGLQAENNAVN